MEAWLKVEPVENCRDRLGGDAEALWVIWILERSDCNTWSVEVVFGVIHVGSVSVLLSSAGIPLRFFGSLLGFGPDFYWA